MSKRQRAAIRPEEGKRYALYVRVSTLGQIEGVRYDSLESQEESLREYVDRHGGAVVKLYSDTESGAKLDERPGLVELMHDAHAGLFDEAVAYHFDRWHRNIEIFAVMKRVTRETGVRFVSATQDFSDDAEGRLIEAQLAAFNAYFSDVVSQKVKLKRRLMAGHGAWCGGRVPFGYKAEDGKLIVVLEEANTVRRVFELYTLHPSPTAVRNGLRALGIRDRQGKPWSTSSIAAILRNPVYAGLVRHPDGEPVPGVHEGIVSKETWDHIRALPPTRKRRVTKVERPYPLVGLLFCGACNQAMTLHYVRKPNGRIFPRYRCVTTFHRGWKECPVKEVNADRIEAWVGEQVQQLSADGPLLDSAIAHANSADEERARPLRDEEAKVTARISEVHGRIERLTDAIAAGGTTFSSIQARLRLEERNLRLLEVEQSRIRAEAGKLSGGSLDPAKIRKLLVDFAMLFAVASQAERKDLLHLLVRRITFRGAGQEVTLELFADVNLGASGSILRTVWLRRRDSNSRPGG